MSTKPHLRACTRVQELPRRVHPSRSKARVTRQRPIGQTGIAKLHHPTAVTQHRRIRRLVIHLPTHRPVRVQVHSRFGNVRCRHLLAARSQRVVGCVPGQAGRQVDRLVEACGGVVECAANAVIAKPNRGA